MPDDGEKPDTPTVVELLLKVGSHTEKAELNKRLLKADKDTRDNKGLTPLHIAASYRNREIVEILMKAGAYTGDRTAERDADVPSVNVSGCILQ